VPYGIVLLLNNCLDDTSSIVRRLIADFSIPISVIDIELSPKMANSGFARRIAMQKAAALANRGAILLTTDADGRVPSDWIDRNLAVTRTGVEVVAGRAELDPIDAQQIPATLHENDAQECFYGRLIDEIDALLDPTPADPWPRHTENSGASLAVTLAAYRRAGGIPAVSPGEDRAFVEALKRTDARIRHAEGISVIVSGRIFGRAIGGMADTIRRRLVQPDVFLDPQLEPATDAAKRARLRHLFRAIKKSQAPDALLRFAQSVSLDQTVIKDALAARYFGTAWAEIERQSPDLVRQPVLVRDLFDQTAQAVSILRVLRNEVGANVPSTHRDDTTLPESNASA
jgi:hypothetical protein